MTKTLAHALRQVLRTLPFIALLLAVLVNDAMAESPVAAPVAVDKVRAFRDGDVFTAEVQTTTPWNGADVQVKYMKDFIQAEVSGAFLNNGKELIRVEDRVFKSVYATQIDASTVRVRFYTKSGTAAKALAERFHAKRSASLVTFEVTGDAGDAALAKTVKDDAQTVAVTDETGANDSMQSKLVAGNDTKSDASAGVANAVAGATGAKAEVKASDAAANPESTQALSTNATDKKLDTNKLSENQIPVLAAVKDAKKSEGSPFFRIIMTLSIAAITLGAAAYGLKRMAAKNGTKGQNTRIKVLTSHHLGPKKNLMIVQVAGETLLIGVTDQNISMLKTLSLLDEEIPEAGPQRFNQAMGDFAELDEEEPIALRGLDQIRDTVSARLKNMRNI